MSSRNIQCWKFKSFLNSKSDIKDWLLFICFLHKCLSLCGFFSPWLLTHRLSQSVFRASPDLRVITVLAKSPYTSLPGPAAHGGSCYRNNRSVRSSELDPHTAGTKGDLHLPLYQPGGLHSQNCIRYRVFSHLHSHGGSHAFQNESPGTPAKLSPLSKQMNTWYIACYYRYHHRWRSTKPLNTYVLKMHNRSDPVWASSALCRFTARSSRYKCHNALWSDSNSMLTPWNETFTPHNR